LRIEYPDAIYHVMSRGDRREDIFYDEVDRQEFLKTLAEACQKADFQVHAYCLMRNHFHLVVETPNGNLVAGMRWLLSAYSLRLNHRRKLFGHVFSGRYKALVVDGSNSGYLRTVCDYVHLNPVRARLLGAEERLLSYPWSSFGWYLAAPAHRPAWMRVDRLLGEHGLGQDTEQARQQFERRMEERRAQEADGAQWEAVRRGWYLGPADFRRELLDRISGQLGEHHAGELRRETAEVKAERIITEELARLGWKGSELERRPRSAPEKVALAARLRRETTLTIRDIAGRLHMGSWKSATTRLHNLKRKDRNGPLISDHLRS
jgi:REP element-mobilizing transposase RayT